MITNLLLKTRIDEKETISEMAQKLNVSESFLIALQSNKKSPCPILCKRFYEIYKKTALLKVI